MAETHYLREMKKIKVFAFDLDAVLTDGSLFISEKGELLRTMNVRDGYAMQLAVRKGYKVCIISSGGKSEGVVTRLKRLGIDDVFMEVKDKTNKLLEFLITHNLNPKDVLYMGDDMPDLKVMSIVGFPCCPADAVQEIVTLCKYISPVNGGKGCVRDVIEKVLKLNNKWE